MMRALVVLLAGAACGHGVASDTRPPTAAETRAEALTGALRRAGVIYWNRDAPCEPWRFVWDAGWGERWNLIHETAGDGWHTTVRYGFSARGDLVSLSGPTRTTEHADSTETRGSYCVVELPIGAVTADHAAVGDLRWYFDRAACERDRTSFLPRTRSRSLGSFSVLP